MLVVFIGEKELLILDFSVALLFPFHFFLIDIEVFDSHLHLIELVFVI
jgi:hypothetical protein